MKKFICLFVIAPLLISCTTSGMKDVITHVPTSPLGKPTDSVAIRSALIDDFTLAVWQYNRDSSEPCTLLLHGNSAPSSYFSTLAKKMKKKGDCVVTFDFPGHGLSGAPNNDFISPATLRASIPAVVNQLELNNYIIVCWSYGCDLSTAEYQIGNLSGVIGYVMTGYAPIDFYGELGPTFRINLVNEGTFYLRDDNSPLVPQKLADSFDLSHVTQPLRVDEELTLIMSYFSADRNIDTTLIDSSLLTKAGVRSGAIMGIGAGELPNGVTSLQAVDVPVMFAIGTEDQLLREEYFDGLIAADIIPNLFSYEKFETGHAIITEEPKKFYRKLRKFRKSL